MNYSIVSVQTVQKFFAVVAVIAMVFGPFVPVPLSHAASWDNWEEFDPQEYDLSEYCSELENVISELDEEIDSLESKLATAEWWEKGIITLAIAAAEHVSPVLNQLYEEYCSGPIDTDEDGIADEIDNCVAVPNEDQANADEDGEGDACDNTPNGPEPVCEDEAANNEGESLPCTYSTVQVHIYKHLVDGETTAQIPDDSGIASFPMVSTWDTTSHGAGTGNYELGDYEGGTALKYAAVTHEMAAGADYKTSEVTGTTVIAIGGQCVADTYRLVGYKYGNTLEEAEIASLEQTAPEFTDLTSDRHLIVVNEDCNDVLDDEVTEPEEELFEVRGSIWNNLNGDTDEDEGEESDIFSGWKVVATKGSDTRSTTTDQFGEYLLMLPEGTWIITQELPSDWGINYPTDGFWEVTLPFETAPAKQNLVGMILNAIIPTAHAMVATSNPLNFGNIFVGTTIPRGNGGNGNRISLRDSDTNDRPAGDVAGDSTSRPEGIVLGDATSTMPVGAPNTGAGGSSVSYSLHGIVAILGTRKGVQATNAK